MAKKKGLKGKVSHDRTKVNKDIKGINAQIKERAFLLYLERQRSGQPGDAMSDWLRAEQQIAH